MALYQKITITDAGAALMSRILTQGGGPLTFEAVAVGSGELNAGEKPEELTGLKAEAKRLPVEAVKNENGRITVTARLATDTLSADLYHREVGIIANGILLAYGNTGAQYDYIPAAGKNAAVQKTIRVPLAIGNMEATFAEMDEEVPVAGKIPVHLPQKSHPLVGLGDVPQSVPAPSQGFSLVGGGAAQELVHRHSEQGGDGGEQLDIGVGGLVLPAANGLVGDSQPLGQLDLGQVLLLPQTAYIFCDA